VKTDKRVLRPGLLVHQLSVDIR